jgi:hypothetical protein
MAQAAVNPANHVFAEGEDLLGNTAAIHQNTG